MVERKLLESQFEPVAIAVRSPLTSAEVVPVYAQLSTCEEDHPWLLVFSASTPFVRPLGSPL